MTPPFLAKRSGDHLEVRRASGSTEDAEQSGGHHVARMPTDQGGYELQGACIVERRDISSRSDSG